MQVQLDSALLQEALSIISKMSPPENGNVNFQVTDRIYIHSAGQLNNCTIRIPSKPEGKCDFALPLEALKAALKGHEKVDLLFKNTLLNIKSGRYKTSLSTFDAIPIESAQIEYDRELKLKAEQVEELRLVLANVAIKPNTFVASFIPCGIRIGKKSTFISCFDTTRMSFATTKAVTGDCEFVLPFDIIFLVLSSFNKTGLTMRISQSTVEVSNPLVTVRIAIPDLGKELPSLEEVIDRASSVKEVKGTKFVVNKESISNFLDNSRAVITKERPEIRFHSKEGKLIFQVASTSGTVQQSMAYKGKVKFNVDGEYFEELVKKCKEDVEFILVEDSFIKCKTGTSTLVMALNQDE